MSLAGRALSDVSVLGGCTLLAAALVSSCSSGGAAPGGAAMGAAATGGSAMGGAAMGGAAMGGAATAGGGVSLAGAQAGGSPGKASGGASSTGGATTAICDAANLVWRTANKTNYTSYPDPGSAECIQFNGCMWAGQFAACNAQKSEQWVSSHNIVAAFPDFNSLELHDLCLRKGSKVLVVTVLDTCGDSDCGGCCTQNQGDADQLIDIESYTNERWGVADGRIEWADLGPTKTGGCE